MQLTLPPAFGNAYIGETFSCCLSANNETTSTISGVQVSAEMQTPSLTLNLDLSGDERPNVDLEAGMSTQKIVKYDLKEEGNHILAVTVIYTEPPKQVLAVGGDGNEEEERPLRRVRTFRKLYQFIAQQCLTVRTKTGSLPGGRAILEAQLENMGDGPISLEVVNFGTKRGWKATSLNWQGSTGLEGDEGDPKLTPMLGAKDVMQVAFLLQPVEPAEPKEEDAATAGGLKVLGQLSIEWRSACGDKGLLSTGRLGLHV